MLLRLSGQANTWLCRRPVTDDYRVICAGDVYVTTTAHANVELDALSNKLKANFGSTQQNFCFLTHT